MKRQRAKGSYDEISKITVGVSDEKAEVTEQTNEKDCSEETGHIKIMQGRGAECLK